MTNAQKAETKKVLGDIGVKLLGMLRVAAIEGSAGGEAAEDMLAKLVFEAYKHGYKDGSTL